MWKHFINEYGKHNSWNIVQHSYNMGTGGQTNTSTITKTVSSTTKVHSNSAVLSYFVTYIQKPQSNVYIRVTYILIHESETYFSLPVSTMYCCSVVHNHFTDLTDQYVNRYNKTFFHNYV
jgi:hypothetical protein